MLHHSSPPQLSEEGRPRCGGEKESTRRSAGVSLQDGQDATRFFGVSTGTEWRERPQQSGKTSRRFQIFAVQTRPDAARGQVFNHSSMEDLYF